MTRLISSSSARLCRPETFITLAVVGSVQVNVLIPPDEAVNIACPAAGGVAAAAICPAVDVSTAGGFAASMRGLSVGAAGTEIAVVPATAPRHRRVDILDRASPLPHVADHVFGADRAAAHIVDSPHGLADALIRLEQASELVAFEGSPAIEPLYTINPFAEEGLAALFVTHPPVAERVRRLRESDPAWRDKLRAA